jgi:hypothetical protein
MVAVGQGPQPGYVGRFRGCLHDAADHPPRERPLPRRGLGGRLFAKDKGRGPFQRPGNACAGSSVYSVRKGESSLPICPGALQ